MTTSRLGTVSIYMAVGGIVLLALFVLSSIYAPGMGGETAITWAVYAFFAVQVAAFLAGVVGRTSSAGIKGAVLSVASIVVFWLYMSF